MIDIDDTRKNVTSLFKLAIENQPSTWLNILGDITEHVDGLDLGESQLRSTIADGIKSARLRLKKEEGALNKLECIIK